MNLYEKIVSIYPELEEKAFSSLIILRNDADGRGDYIAEWSHPVFPRPSEEQIAALEAPSTGGQA